LLVEAAFALCTVLSSFNRQFDAKTTITLIESGEASKPVFIEKRYYSRMEREFLRVTGEY